MGKHVILKNVRCSFPQLYKSEIKNDQTFDPGITVLLKSPEHDTAVKQLQASIREAVESNPKLKKQPPKGDKVCLKDSASDSWRDEFAGHDFMIKAGCKQPPVVLHKNMERMTEADNKIYSGCLVNIKVEIWGQANQYGRRVNAKLLAVQFAGDGESFDGSYVSEETAAEGFGSLDDSFDNIPESVDSDDIMG